MHQCINIYIYIYICTGREREREREIERERYIYIYTTSAAVPFPYFPLISLAASPSLGRLLLPAGPQDLETRRVRRRRKFGTERWRRKPLQGAGRRVTEGVLGSAVPVIVINGYITFIRGLRTIVYHSYRADIPTYEGL